MLNPADVPSWRSDYMAGRVDEEASVAQLLPSLSSKMAKNKLETMLKATFKEISERPGHYV